MGYSEDDSMVRVDFFRETGKWYTTEAVKWTGDYKDSLVPDQFRKALLDHLTQENGTIRLSGMWAVCLEPYHEHSHPIMVRVPIAGQTLPAAREESSGYEG